MADVKIRIVGEDHASAELDKIGNKVSTFTKELGKMAAGFAAAGLASKKIFEFGEMGAQAIQTAESFDILLGKVGAAPDLLSQLKSASKGTISELELMSSTSLLLAGTSGELATELANSTPRLLEIAKAANKLNPSLGDTTFMYDSLSRGIKRASPLILDNLGLVVSVGDANAKYAESIGKTVEELTAEEEKIALLNSVLEQGDTLIDQVGGTTDSTTDSFARMNVAIEESKTALQESLTPMLAEAAEAIATLLTWNDKLKASLDEHRTEIQSTAKSYDEYRVEMERAAEAAGFFVDEQGNLVDMITTASGRPMEKIIEETYLLSEAEWEAKENIEGASEAVGDQIAAYERGRESTRDYAEEANNLAKVLEEGLAAGIKGELKDALDNYSEKMRSLQDENQELHDKIVDLIVDGIDPASDTVAELSKQIDDNTREQSELAEQLQLTTREMVYQRAAADLDTEAALELARAMDLISEADYELASAIQDVRNEFDLNADGMIDATEAANGYNQSILDVTTSALDGLPTLEEQNLALETYATNTDTASDAAERLTQIQSALSAGLSGELNQSMSDYHQTLRDLHDENEELQFKIDGIQQASDEYKELNKQLDGYTERNEAVFADNEIIVRMNELYSNGVETSAEELEKLNRQLDDNKQKQEAARDAMRESIAQMIYQQAASGLSADASLELARGMGLVSEQDYAVAAAIEQLRDAYDTNNDSQIDATEGAYDYARQIKELNDRVLQLQGANENITLATLGYNDSLGTANQSLLGMTRETQATIEEVDALQLSHENLNLEIDNTTDANERFVDYTGNVNDGLEAETTALEILTDGLGQNKESVKQLNDAIVILTDNYEANKLALAQLNIVLAMSDTYYAEAYKEAGNYTDGLHKLLKVVRALQAEGVDVGGSVTLGNGSIDRFGKNYYPEQSQVGSRGYNYSGTTTSGSSVTLNYSPFLSTASSYEAEQVLRPIIEDVVRSMR